MGERGPGNHYLWSETFSFALRLETTMEGAFRRIQPSEYYKRFLRYQIRPDGRHLAAVRDVRIMRNVLKDAAVGSAIVTAGHSRFLAGVTAEIAPPHPVAPTSGRIVVSVEFPQSCGVHASFREVGQDASSLAARTSVSLCTIFSNPEVIDLSQFCIRKGNAIWMLYVNVICLEYDGNAIDWALCSVTAALENTILPSIEWDSKYQWWRICNGEMDRELSGELKEELLWRGRPVELVGRPSSVTLSKVLENYWLVDPTLDECQLGDPITIWRATTKAPSSSPTLSSQELTEKGGQLRILRQGENSIDIQGLLYPLLEVSHSGIQAMERAIQKAVEDSEENIWEVCSNDEDKSNSGGELS